MDAKMKANLQRRCIDLVNDLVEIEKLRLPENRSPEFEATIRATVKTFGQPYDETAHACIEFLRREKQDQLANAGAKLEVG